MIPPSAAGASVVAVVGAAVVSVVASVVDESSAASVVSVGSPLLHAARNSPNARRAASALLCRPFLHMSSLLWADGPLSPSNGEHIPQMAAKHARRGWISVEEAHRGGILAPASRRITSPFSSGFSTIACTRWAKSSGS